jgi:hypothetical protein
MPVATVNALTIAATIFGRHILCNGMRPTLYGAVIGDFDFTSARAYAVNLMHQIKAEDRLLTKTSTSEVALDRPLREQPSRLLFYDRFNVLIPSRENQSRNVATKLVDFQNQSDARYQDIWCPSVNLLGRIEIGKNFDLAHPILARCLTLVHNDKRESRPRQLGIEASPGVVNAFRRRILTFSEMIGPNKRKTPRQRPLTLSVKAPTKFMSRIGTIRHRCERQARSATAKHHWTNAPQMIMRVALLMQVMSDSHYAAERISSPSWLAAQDLVFHSITSCEMLTRKWLALESDAGRWRHATSRHRRDMVEKMVR